MTPGAWRIARITLGCGALLAAAPGTDAVTLGKAELRSRRGEPLEARIPLTAAPSEALRGACFSLLPEPRGPLAAGARLELRHHARGADLYVRSRAAVSDPAVAFAIVVACPGAQGSEPVRYSLALSDSAPAPAPVTLPVSAPAAAALPVVTRLQARDGDTFASLAHAIFPGDAQVRSRYIAAMRAENAALASLGDDEPLPAGTAVALPDLHAFAATVPASHPAQGRAMRSGIAARPSARAARKTAEAPTALAQVPESLRTKAAPPVAPRNAAAPAHGAAAAIPRGAARQGDGFQLRLSAPTMDLSPSKGMDEQRRAELRERLLVLEADDRTAAMLEMRENIRRLESQVNALKLKLATLEAAPVTRAEPVAPKPPPAAPAPVAKPPAVVAQPAPVPKATPAPVAPPAPAPVAKIAPASPGKAAPAPATTPAPSRSPVRAEAPRKPRAAPAQPWYEDRRWLGGLATILVIAWLALRMRVRSAEEPEIIEAPPEEPASDIPDTGAPPTTEPHDVGVAEEPGIATRVPPDDRTELRRRYMEERFPEIVNGALVLEDERSVVKAARLLYEDGTAPRAIELLQFAIEQDPGQLRPWLALFEIFRLESLKGEFGELATRFRDRHGATDEWRKVRSIGRSLDPGNPLYQGTEYGAPVDPEAEGWLRSPSDEAGRALAGELRAKLMSEAGVTEEALRADPTPALRKAEMFNVA